MIVEFFIILALYFLMFNPAFTFLGGLHTAMLLWPLIALLLVGGIRNRLYVHKKVFIAWFFVFVFVVIRTIIGGDSSFVVRFLAVLIESILVSYVLIVLSFRYKVNLERALLITASIAGVISCICLFNPSFNAFTKSILVIKNDYLLLNSFRGFGIGDEFTFSYGVVLGLICALGIFRISENKWFLLFIPFVCIAILVNARSGIIPVIISILLYFISLRKFSALLLTILAGIVIIFLWQYVIVNYIPDDTLLWTTRFFYEVMEGKEGETVGALSSMKVLPDNPIDWIIGTGNNAFVYYMGKRTDIGYQIQLYYGGIVYLGLLINLIFQLIKSAYKSIPKLYLITIVLSLLLFNYKGELIANRMSFTSFVFIMMYYAQLARKNGEKKTIGVKNKTIIKTDEQTLQYESK